jgi:hypothetical protein
MIPGGVVVFFGFSCFTDYNTTKLFLVVLGCWLSSGNNEVISIKTKKYG